MIEIIMGEALIEKQPIKRGKRGSISKSPKSLPKEYHSGQGRVMREDEDGVRMILLKKVICL